MKKNILKILVFLLTLFLVSCKAGTEKDEMKYLTDALGQLNIDHQFDWVVVLPGLGCHGCIQEGEFFMKENISNTKILFVLTNISSLKILQQKINIRVSDHSNIYVDRDNLFKITTENAIYPCIIQMKNGMILQYSFQSPKTTAFYNLRKHLKINKN